MNIVELMKQIQRIKSNLEELQEEMKNREFLGEAGAGLVRVVINGALDVISVEISEEAMEDKKALEVLVRVAFQDALNKFKESGESIFKGLFPFKFGGLS
ncbi:MAG: YbaB/EbfC family nucleoid-associated protein [Thermosulfidibacteraceae bacterium]